MTTQAQAPSTALRTALLEIEAFRTKYGYKAEILPDEQKAIRRVEIIATLGFPVTHEMIDAELRITRDSIKRKSALLDAGGKPQ